MNVEEMLTMKGSPRTSCKIHLVHEKNPKTLLHAGTVLPANRWSGSMVSAYTTATKFGPLFVRALTDCTSYQWLPSLRQQNNVQLIAFIL